VRRALLPLLIVAAVIAAACGGEPTGLPRATLCPARFDTSYVNAGDTTFVIIHRIPVCDSVVAAAPPAPSNHSTIVPRFDDPYVVLFYGAGLVLLIVALVSRRREVRRDRFRAR
jgi:hypothetical protein